MTDEKRQAAAVERYMAAMHAVQTAVKFRIGLLGENGAGADAKHLRTGIDSAMIADRAIANLLIARGLFSKTEYLEAVADAAELEVAENETRHPGITFR